MKRAPAERSAFRYVFMKCDQKKSGEIACFGSAQNQPCGRCCASLITPKITFKPCKLDRTSKASYETSACREIRFSLRIYEMRSKKKWRNCMFWKRPKPAMWAMLRNLHYPKKAPTGTHAKHYLSFIATLNFWVGGNAVQGCTLPVHPSLSTTSPL